MDFKLDGQKKSWDASPALTVHPSTGREAGEIGPASTAAAFPGAVPARSRTLETAVSTNKLNPLGLKPKSNQKPSLSGNWR